ncbi:MAG TPA: cupredoxin domain-containing protein [Actinomycetota bacterium]|nr:cupredoxin domain-containing protein [Actinomycetota bacterium]
MFKSPKAIIALAVVAFVEFSGAAAADPPIPPRAAVGPQAKFYGYLTPVIVISKGEALTFSSLDLENHDFVQDVEVDGFGGPKKMPWCSKGHDHGGAGNHHEKSPPCPIFWSELIGLNESTEVLGLKNLKSGTTYSFFCTLHHGMKGKLIVQ